MSKKMNGGLLFAIKYIRNYEKIKKYMMEELSKRHQIELTSMWNMDFLVDNELYLKIALFIDINQLYSLAYTIKDPPKLKEKMYFICFEEDEKYLNYIIENCPIIVIDKNTIEEYIERVFIRKVASPHV